MKSLITRGVPNSGEKKPPARVIWGSTRGPTEMELELQLTAVGLQLTVVVCSRRRWASNWRRLAVTDGGWAATNGGSAVTDPRIGGQSLGKKKSAHLGTALMKSTCPETGRGVGQGGALGCPVHLAPLSATSLRGGLPWSLCMTLSPSPGPQDNDSSSMAGSPCEEPPFRSAPSLHRQDVP